MTINHQARKRFGQNFLIDQQIIGQIVACVAPKPADNLIEIGPGMAAITERLITGCPNMSVLELDRDLVKFLEEKFVDQPDFSVHNGDALKTDFEQFYDGRKLRLVGNLPYNISTPLIFHLLSYTDLIADMHFMLQKEVVLRLAAGAGTNNYGRLSIMAQYFCRVDSLFEVPPEAFEPRPKVDSAIVRMAPYTELPHTAHDFKHFEQLVKSGFSQRRKTLRNNLKGIASDEQLQSLGIDPSIRSERLTVGEFVAISNLLTQTSS